MMIVPAEWMPDCEMKAIVAHWTAGGHRASSLDMEHYHVLIEADGSVVRGDHVISDNVDTSDDDYAAHTRSFNTRTIGISVCCMMGAREKPFSPGAFPMTEKQWLVMANVAADLARRYKIPIDDKHVLGHGEVQRNLGIKQRGKWDPMVLPWDIDISPEKVGNLFRVKVREFYDNAAPTRIT